VNPDDHVCLCFRVSQRKLVAFMERTRPRVASQLSDCLGAGTGCHWCVPFLRRMHEQWSAGERVDLRVSPVTYAEKRARYRATGTRDESFDDPDSATRRDGGGADEGGGAPPPDPSPPS